MRGIAEATRSDRLVFRLQIINLLRLLKQRRTYSQLSQITGLPATVLSRYIQGHVLPNFERARELWRIINKKVNLRDEMVECIGYDGGFYDNTRVLSHPMYRWVFSTWILDQVIGSKVDKVLTAAVDGIPLAATVSDVLNVPLVVAKKEREIGVKEFWTEEVVWPSGRCETLYVPKHLLGKKDWVIIVDDVIRTGTTQRALCNLVQKARGKVVGIFALLKLGEAEMLADVEAPVKAYIDFHKNAKRGR